MNAPVEVRQGETVWNLRLIDLSLTGLAVTEPDDLDADYSDRFHFNLPLEAEPALEFDGHLINMDPGRIGFDIDEMSDSHHN